MTNTNRSPVLDAINNQTVAENTAIAAINAADGGDDFDADGQAITYSCSVNAANCSTLIGVAFDTATGGMTWTPDYTQAGTYNFTITGSDGLLTDNELFSITVTNLNRAPVLDAINDQTVNEGVAIAAINAADGGDDLDIDNQVITYSCNVDGSNCSTLTGVSFNTATGAMTWTPNYSQAGTYNFTITGSDGALTDDEAFVITVNNTNQPPVLDAIANQTVAEGTAITAINAADTGDDLDADGQAITYSCDVGGSDCSTLNGVNFNTATGVLTWTPDYTQAGTYNFTITGSDGSLTDDEAFTITVTNANRPPVLDAIGNETVAEGTAITAINAADGGDDLDIDSEAITYSCDVDGSNCSTLAGVNFNTATGAMTWTPDYTQAGTYNFTLTGTDGALTDDEAFTVTVTNTNRPPVLDAIGDQAVAEGAAITAINAADGGDDLDIDGEAITYSCDVGGSDCSTLTGVNFNTATGAMTWTPNYTQSGTYNFTLTGTDGALSDDEVFTVTVTNSNIPPELDAINDQTVSEGSAITAIDARDLHTTNDTDRDGQAITYSCDVGGSDCSTLAGVVFDTATGAMTWTPDYTQAGTYNFTITGSDGALTDDESFTITVTGTNLPPVLDAIADQTVAEGTAIAAINAADGGDDLDIDNQVITYSCDVGGSDCSTLTGVIFDTATGAMSWTPDFDQAGTYNFTITGSDGALTDDESFTITVTGTNQPPVLDAIADQTVAEGTAITAINAADGGDDLDADGEAITYSCDVGGSDCSTLTGVVFDTGTGAMTWTPDYTQSGTYNFTITGSDGALTDDEAFTITVTNFNRPPVLDAIADQTVAEGAAITAINAADGGDDLDADGEAITYSCDVGGSDCSTLTGVNFNIATGAMSWTPDFDQAGTYNFTITGSDGALTDDEAFAITVTNDSLPPVLDAIADQTLAEGAAITSINANDLHTAGDTDRDGEVLSYACYYDTTLDGTVDPTFACTGLGATFSTMTGELDWTPNYTHADNYEFKIIATDPGLLSDDELFTITVTNTNRPPVLDAIADQTVAENTAITAIDAADGGDDLDIDNQAITYSCDVGGSDCSTLAGVVFDTATGEMSWTPDYTQAGTYNFTITGSDGALTDDEVFTLTVTNSNRPPVLDAIGDETVAEGAAIAAINAADGGDDLDIDGQAITYSCDVGGSDCSTLTGVNFNTATGALTWTPDYTQAGTYNFTITGTDGALTDDEAFTITVTGTNLPPVLDAIADQTVAEGAAITAINAADGADDLDIDGQAITYSCDVDGSDCSTLAGVVFDTATGDMSWTPDYTQSGTYNFTLTGTDGALTDDEAFTVTITNSNRPPVLDAIADQTVAEGTAITAINAADGGDDLDIDGEAITYSCDVDGSDCSTLTGVNFNTATGAMTWTPDYTQSGIYNFTITATDGTLTDDEAFTITVSNASLPPELSIIGDQTVAEGTAIATIDAFDMNTSGDTDRDGEVLSYACYYDTTLDGTVDQTFACTGLGATFSTMTGELDWTPNYTHAANYEFKIIATDPGLLSDDELFTITVTNTNLPPVLDAIADQTVAEGVAIVAIDAADGADDLDIDGQAITYSCDVGGSDCSTLTGVVFDTATGEMSWTPDYTQAGTYNFTITGSDGVLTDDEAFTITVTNSNRPPVLDAIADQTVAEGAAIAAINAADGGDDLDIDGQAITYSCDVDGSDCSTLTGVVFDTATGEMSWTPDYAQAGTYNFTITGTDGALTDDETFTITVTNSNRPPVLDAIADQTVAEGAVIVAIDAADGGDDLDIDGEAITYSCNVDGSDCSTLAGVVFDTATGEMSWTPDYTQAGTYSFTITGSDGVLTDDEVFTITATNTNRPPELDAIADQTIAENTAITAINAADGGDDLDVDNQAITYSCDVDVSDCATLGVVFDSATGVMNWTPNYTHAGTYNFTITGTDGALSDSEPFTITVTNVNRPPVLAAIDNQTGEESYAITTINANDGGDDFDIDLEAITYSCFYDTAIDTSVADSAVCTDLTGVSFNTATGVMDWTPTLGQAGSYEFKIVGKDPSNAQDEKIFSITVATYRAPFISTWRTTAPGESITFPLVSGRTYNFTVDWGDGSALSTVTAYNDPDITHSYAVAGDYVVTIKGTLQEWRFDNTGSKDKIISVSQFGQMGYVNLYAAFHGCKNLVSFIAGTTDTSAVTANMNSMFAEASNLTTLDLSTFDTSNVGQMIGTFKYALKLTNLNLSNFNTAKVTSMSDMFLGATNITELELTSFNTSNVIDMRQTFRDMSKLTALNISSFNTAKVENMESMFNGARNLTALDLSHFDTSSVTSMKDMFTSTESLTSLNVSNFNTLKTTNMNGMFFNALKLTSLDLSSFNTANTAGMNNMFYGAGNLTALDISNFNTSNVTNMLGMFYGVAKLGSLNLSHFNTEKVTDMSSMFLNAQNLSTLDISSFNTINVTKMTSMFTGTGNITSLDLNHFNTAKVTSMRQMFSNMWKLESVNLANFNTAQVTEMDSMFYKTYNLINLDLSHFDTSKVISVDNMFTDNVDLTTLKLYNWDIDPAPTSTNVFQNFNGELFCNQPSGEMFGKQCNKFPVLAEIGDQTVAEQIAIAQVDANGAVSGADTDADGETISYNCYVDSTVDGTVANTFDCTTTGATFSTMTGIMDWNTVYGDMGSYEFRIEASDIHGQKSSELFVITVTKGDYPPVLDAIADQTVAEGSAITAINAADGGDDLDVDNQAITYSCDVDGSNCSTLTGVNFNTATGVMTWTPNYDQAGSYNFTLTGTDGALTDDEAFTITVTDTNRSPDLDNIPNQTAEETIPITTVDANDSSDDLDADLETITYSCFYDTTIDSAVAESTNCTALTGVSFNTTTGVMDWTPALGQAGNYEFKIIGKDPSDAEASKIFSITVATYRTPFTSIWRTSSDGESITLPLRSGFNYNFTVNWGDGSAISTVTSFDDPDITHTYATTGDYTVTIRGSVEAWYFNNGGSKDSIIAVNELGDVGWKNLSKAFKGCTNLNSFRGGNTADVTNMSSMFFGANIIGLDLTSFNTSNVTDMSLMFTSSIGNGSLDFSSFNSERVVNMNQMFAFAQDIETLDLSSLETSNVTTMRSMFAGTSNLTTINLSGFNTANVTDMAWMLSQSNITSLDLSSFNTSNVTDMTFMFFQTPNLATIDISSFDISAQTSLYAIFKESGVTTLDLSHFNTSLITDFRDLFMNASNLTHLTLNTWDISNSLFSSDIFTGFTGELFCDQPSGEMFGKQCNKFPVLAAIGDQTVAEQIAIAQINANGAVSGADTDADGETISYNCYVDSTVDGTVANTFDCSTVGATFSTMTGIMDWTPNFGQMASYEFRIEASDPHGQKSSELFAITVTQGNHPPELAAISNQVTSENQAITTINASDTNTSNDTDIDGDALSYTCTYDGVVDGAVNAGSNCTVAGVVFDVGTGIFNWTPDYTQSGDWEFKIVTTDLGGSTDAMIFTIGVNNVNRPPVLKAIANQAVDTGNAIATINGEDANTNSDSDIDGEALTYSCYYDTTIDGAVSTASACSGITGITFNSSAGTINWTPASGQQSDYEFKIVASDGSATDNQIFTIEVTYSNLFAPDLIDLENHSIAEGASITAVDVNDRHTGNDTDRDGNVISYSCLVNAADCSTLLGLSFDSNTSKISWTPNYTQAGLYSFTITGSDGVSADATSFDITVNNSKLIPSSIAINGQVSALEKVGDILYIGGNFSSVGYNIGAGVILKNAACTGAACISDNILNLAQMPKIIGEIHTSISDGNGGYYIGGYFTRIGSYLRTNIVHILSDGSVDPSFNPNLDNGVYALLLSGSTLYIAGEFTTVNGESRMNLAAIDLSTTAVTSFNPSSEEGYYPALAISGSTLYVGGSFTSIGGQARTNLAAIDTATGLATSFNFPTYIDVGNNGTIYALLIDGNKLYVAGYFAKLGGVDRSHIAAIDITTNQLTSFNPQPDNDIRLMALSDSTLYVAGNFNNVGGESRNYLAAIDTNTGAPTDFNPDPSSEVYALAINQTELFVGGYFDEIAGVTRNRIASFDLATKAVTNFAPGFQQPVKTISLFNDQLYVGGVFSAIDIATRNSLAAIDTSTGMLTSFNPSPNGLISLIKEDAGTLYVSGEFNQIAGEPRSGFAAFDTATGLITSFDPAPDGSIYDLVIDGSTLYVSGGFNNIGGQIRPNLAALDATTSLATGFAPSAVGATIYALALDGTTLYVGGQFTTIGGQARKNLAAINTTTGLATSFNAVLSNGIISSLGLDNQTLYISGTFTAVGGDSRNNIAAIDTTTGLATNFNPGSDNYVAKLKLSGNTLYVTGYWFTQIGGLNRERIAAIDTVTSIPTSFNPVTPGEIITMHIDGNDLYIGGEFTIVDEQVQTSFTQFDLSLD